MSPGLLEKKIQMIQNDRTNIRLGLSRAKRKANEDIQIMCERVKCRDDKQRADLFRERKQRETKK
jgi:hypothetical protein